MPGDWADVWDLIGRGPTLDIVALREWPILFVDGRRYDRAKVDEWLDDDRKVFHGGSQRHIVSPLVAKAIGFFSQD